MSAGAPDGAAKGPTATLLVQSPPVAQAPLSPGHYSATQPPEVASTVHGQLGLTIRGRLPPTDYSRLHITCCSKLGRRKKQEDRCTLVPRVFGRDDVTFLGVFDGTVGDHAADYVHSTLAEQICGHRAFKEAITTAGSLPSGFLEPSVIEKVATALKEGYQATDSGLIAMCRERGIDYSACTSVTAVMCGDLLSIAHLGDSKIVLGRFADGGSGSGGSGGGGGGAPLVGKYLTTDHKPDMPHERRRIEESGGSLAYLHGGKPFIRGGDFTARQALGDRPMQLNYSRAFGGKDLKMFGLSWVPDILHIRVTSADKVIVVASDGLWDVADADTAVRLAWESYTAGRDAAMDMVDWALEQHDMRGTIDNVTVAVAVLR